MEDVCGVEACHIGRAYRADLPICPAPTCSSNASVLSDMAYLEANCKDLCAGDQCRDAFRRVVAHHDLCPEEQVPTAVEVGIHDVEDACAINQCNSANVTDPNSCDEKHDDHDHDHDHDHHESCGYAAYALSVSQHALPLYL